MKTRSLFRIIVSLFAVAALVGLGACGDDDDGDAADTTTTEADDGGTDDGGTDDGEGDGGTPDDPEAAEAEITTNIEGLFNSLGEAAVAEDEAAKQEARDRTVSLIENGEQFREQVVSFEPLAEGLTAEVKSVEFTGSATADITYDLLIGGSPQLPDAQGKAVLVDGTWKLSQETWEALAALTENNDGGGEGGEGGDAGGEGGDADGEGG